jgi:ketosteroid isomerase-like protein
MFSKSMLIACAVAALAANPARASCPAATESDIHGAYETWLSAYKARDLGGTMAIFDKAVVFQFQGSPDAGWNDLKAGYQSEFAGSSKGDWVPEFRKIEVSGDLAAAFLNWTFVKAGTAVQTNVSVDLFRRTPACTWSIVRSMNYPRK